MLHCQMNGVDRMFQEVPVKMTFDMQSFQDSSQLTLRCCKDWYWRWWYSRGTCIYFGCTSINFGCTCIHVRGSCIQIRYWCRVVPCRGLLQCGCGTCGWCRFINCFFVVDRFWIIIWVQMWWCIIQDKHHGTGNCSTRRWSGCWWYGGFFGRCFRCFWWTFIFTRTFIITRTFIVFFLVTSYFSFRDFSVTGSRRSRTE